MTRASLASPGLCPGSLNSAPYLPVPTLDIDEGRPLFHRVVGAGVCTPGEWLPSAPARAVP